jgi:myo-inositol 2-dehydrogenase/D-chiro-inositol 1-dehydrogenase
MILKTRWKPSAAPSHCNLVYRKDLAMIKVGLLGAGRIAGVHATAISSNPGSTLAAVSDYIPENAEKLAAEYGSTARTTEEIIADASIDAVLIATSTDTHSDLIEAATAAGKAVLCEKPVDLSLERARNCQAETKASGKPIMIGFNRRFDPNFSNLKTAYDAGEIGKGELLSLISYDPAPPPISYVKVSGGLFRDMAIHDFDMACWLMGSAPERVSATGSCVVDPEIGAAGDVDTAVTVLHFHSGAMAVIKNSRRAAYGYDQRIELLGEGGLLSADNMLESTVRKASATNVTSAKPRYFFLERYAASYANAWSAFVTAALEGAAVPVTIQDGVNALAIAEAATQAAKSGETVPVSTGSGVVSQGSVR